MIYLLIAVGVVAFALWWCWNNYLFPFQDAEFRQWQARLPKCDPFPIESTIAYAIIGVLATLAICAIVASPLIINGIPFVLF